LTVAVVGIAIWALAGSFWTSGSVLPSHGTANDTIFTWRVTYAKSPGQSAPTVCLARYRNGSAYGGAVMMAIDQQGDILVDYFYQDKLPAGTYSFEMWTDDDETEGNGPQVSD